MNNEQTVNTLKEISDLKHEIIKLTSSLKCLEVPIFEMTEHRRS